MTVQSPPISGGYAADPIHSSVGFAVRYMRVSTFRGTFDSVSAKLDVRPSEVARAGSAEVESISIYTPEQFRAHVLGDEFLAASAHPLITFTARHVALDEDGAATATGSLTIKENTRPVMAHGGWSPPTPGPTGKTRAHLALEATVNRRDYGINWASRPWPDNCLRGKPVVLVGASTGLFGAVWAQAEVRKMVATIGADVVENELSVGQALEAFDDEGRLVEPELALKLEEAVAAVIVRAARSLEPAPC